MTRTMQRLLELDREYEEAGISETDVRRLILRSNPAWMEYLSVRVPGHLKLNVNGGNDGR